MSNGDVECALRACRLLQSNNADSAELIRLYLDEAIKQKHGSHKTITNLLKKDVCIIYSTSFLDNKWVNCNLFSDRY